MLLEIKQRVKLKVLEEKIVTELNNSNARVYEIKN